MSQTNIKTGLSTSEVEFLQKEYGLNRIDIKSKNTVWKILFSQFTSIIIIILFACSFIFLFMGDTLEFILVLVIIVINGLIGFIQEYKADKAVDSLKKLLVKTTLVLRDGQKFEINTEELVPGDIVYITEGDKVPADLKILEDYSLIVDESVLNGESVPVTKENGSQLLSGTTIVSGKGIAIVEKIGLNTEFGKIINLVSKDQEEKTHLEVQIDKLSKVLIYVLLVSFVVLFVLGILRGEHIFEIFLISVSLAISAIPEGLPIVMTLTLANGVQLMSKKNAIVKKLSSIEALGATTVICSDKTGTLTLNEMNVERVYTFGYEKYISSSGYSVEEKEVIDNRDAHKLIDIANNCNNSVVDKNIYGDPTEIALKILAKKAQLTNEYKFIDEIPFSSQRKMMSTIHEIGGQYEMFTKGAFGEVINKCDKVLDNGHVRKLTDKDILKFRTFEEKYASDALRVLAFSYRQMSTSKDKKEEGMVFVGIVGMMDPPRPDVKQALEIARKAGIRTKIITGDNALTAKAIAEKIGIINPQVVIASVLDKLTDKQATELIQKVDIFARAKPEHKYRIVELLQKAGEVVAVTGDGVNDAPALKKADIGIAMGIKGTEATKEVADIVLKDDNYSSIISAIKEGRRVYDNILLFVKYMLAVNFDLLFVVAILTVAAFPIPLLALQILWINLVTDSLPAIALGRKKAVDDIMSRKPNNNKDNSFKSFGTFIIIALIIKIVGEIILFSYGLQIDQSLGINPFDVTQNSYARTLLLTGIVMFELIFAFFCNSDGSLRLKKLFSNTFLIVSVVIVIALQLFLIYNPFMQHAFKTVALSLKDWGLIILFGLFSFFIIPLSNYLEKKIFKKTI
ncbi:MAG: cation-translocating P-type ATPase [archaeon]|jgi:Ca2+-transporting ATPase